MMLVKLLYTYLIVYSELVEEIEIHKHSYAGFDCVVIVQTKIVKTVVKQTIITAWRYHSILKQKNDDP